MSEKPRARKPHDQSPAPAATAEPLEALIRRRAYELYLERGARAGSPVEDWLRAEQEACAR
jgi:hypothetical protein